MSFSRLTASVSQDISSSFMALKSLQADIEAAPQCVDLETVQSLKRALLDHSFAGQTCAPFVYQETARILSSIMASTHRPEVSQAAYQALKGCALHTLGNPCMAAAQALGTLPLSLPRKEDPHLVADASPPLADFEHLLTRSGFTGHSLTWAGRNLIVSDSEADPLLVLKCAHDRMDLQGLYLEAAWMSSLAEGPDFPEKCELPRPLYFFSHPLLQVDLSKAIEETSHMRPAGQPADAPLVITALPYVVSRDYFAYPNEPGHLPGPAQFSRVLARTAANFGHLSAQGLLHTAAIPLFHNRTQQTRRDDGGRYIWTRKGRLDRWLHSCRFPNFGLSGLRDFEHIRCWNEQGRDLFQEVGAQIFSLLLVAGSYFRFKAPDRIGLDEHGSPLDCRDLFDPDLLSELVSIIVTSYHQGFTGRSMENLPGSQQHLVQRMIEELGMDRHMTETLRVRDQTAMSSAEFTAFLSQRGIGRNQQAALTQGNHDLTLVTGPHLGEFNGPTSLPELIDFTAAAAAVCIASKYLDQTSPEPSSASHVSARMRLHGEGPLSPAGNSPWKRGAFKESS